jgi:hypothetical protein
VKRSLRFRILILVGLGTLGIMVVVAATFWVTEPQLDQVETPTFLARKNLAGQGLAVILPIQRTPHIRALWKKRARGRSQVKREAAMNATYSAQKRLELGDVLIGPRTRLCWLIGALNLLSGERH